MKAANKYYHSNSSVSRHFYCNRYSLEYLFDSNNVTFL